MGGWGWGLRGLFSLGSFWMGERRGWGGEVAFSHTVILLLAHQSSRIDLPFAAAISP